MRKRRHPIDDPETIADADSSLRSMSRLFSDVLAQWIVRPGERINRLDWGETQLTARQRRVDRTLHVEVEGSGSRVLHLEWVYRLDQRALESIAEYHVLLARAVRQDARRKQKRAGPEPRVSVESVAVVLTGRKKPWPKFGVYRTSPQGKPFTGVKFRIEAVYQRTVAELEAKGSVFWLAFVPLALDADEKKIRRTVDKVRAQTNSEEFSEIVATMLSMAHLKKDRPHFPYVVWSAAKEGSTVRHLLFREGRKEGRVEGLAPLLYLFERRLERSLTESERHRIASRLTKEGPQKLGSAVLDLSREELAAWLAPRKRKPS